MAWLSTLRENPFAPALRLLASRAGQPEEAQGGPSPTKVEQQQSPEASAGGTSGGGRSSAANDREEQKMQQYVRQFEQMAAKETRRKKMQALKQEREASDPCKCGRARSKRLPRPLATGGPRCNQCLPLVPERGAPVLRDAPVFYPTAEEFEDPMSYIRSIQAQFFEFGICSIQPPPSWQPPTSFHWRSAQQEQWKEEAQQQAAQEEQEAQEQEQQQEQQQQEEQPQAASKAAATAGGAAAEKKTEEKGKASAAERKAAGEGAAGSEWDPITDDSDFFARLQALHLVDCTD